MCVDQSGIRGGNKLRERDLRAWRKQENKSVIIRLMMKQTEKNLNDDKEKFSGNVGH